MTASDASTVAEDASVLHTTELPSQVDDLDGDFKPDELAFQIDLKPHQTRIVTITWGAADRIFRLRGDYEKQTNAIFTRKIDGMGWESKRNAFRLYFDKRNAIDLYGKPRPSLQLDRYATPGYIYHNYSPDGRDIYLVADALGIGAPAGWVNGTAEHVAEVDDRSWRIISAGPVRAVITSPQDGFAAAAGAPLAVRGHAWSGHTPLAKVELSCDGGRSWQAAQLGPLPDTFAWRRFTAVLAAPPAGAVELIARASDAAGRAQPLESVPWNPKGYGNNTVHRLRGRIE